MIFERQCSIDGCENKHQAKGYCDKHYSKLRRYGNPLHTEKERHGLSGSPEYMAWSDMKSRCTNAKNKMYKHYGGRGITVCNEWMNSFKTFFKDLGPRPTDKHSIDRINNDGNYEPSNCRWVNSSVQNFNRGPSSRNTSGHVGISWSEHHGKWEASIQFEGERKRLGYFTNIEDAIIIRKNEESKIII